MVIEATARGCRLLDRSENQLPIATQHRHRALANPTGLRIQITRIEFACCLPSLIHSVTCPVTRIATNHGHALFEL